MSFFKVHKQAAVYVLGSKLLISFVQVAEHLVSLTTRKSSDVKGADETEAEP